MTETHLPPGQRAIATFPRFGLIEFAGRFPEVSGDDGIKVSGDVGNPVTIGAEMARLPRVEQTSDFHCVTTWSSLGLQWGGVRFADFYRELVVPLAAPSADATFVVLRARDGAHISLPLEDLLQGDVLLADRLHGEALTVEHGGPMRIVAPGHYGYKNIKFINRIEFWRTGDNYRPYGFRFMAHPRGRVWLEERGQWIPGWVLRYVYRPMIGPTIKYFERALARHGARSNV